MTLPLIKSTQADPYQAAYSLHLFIGAVIERDILLRTIPLAVRDVMRCAGVALLEAGAEPGIFRLAASVEAGDVKQYKDVISDKSEDAPVQSWRRGTACLIDARTDNAAAGAAFIPVLDALPKTRLYSAPATADGTLFGVLIAYDDGDLSESFLQERLATLAVLARTVGIALANARRYRRAEEESEKRELELNMLAQIDRELSDSIRLESVYAMALDWAMRFTRAHAAYVSLVDEKSGAMLPVASLGYERPPEAMIALFENAGIAQRVGRTNRSEIVPDLALDTEHVPISIAMRSHLSVPVTREDRVIAVISLESRKLNAFTDPHTDFTAKLSARAGIAIDNARLYTEAVREREQTGNILRAIADVVIVIGQDERVLLINSSAISVLRLYPDTSYIGRRLSEIIENDHPVVTLYRKAALGGQTLSDQISLPGDRSYSIMIAPHTDVGWIVVMHDLSAVRQADQLKHDFISVLSHDLKQPISVVKGYVELIEMTFPDMSERAAKYMGMIFQSLENMRKLIDDMLDLARLDSGIDIVREKIATESLLVSVVEWIRPAAEVKSMLVEAVTLADLPPLIGDKTRLMQLFVNLVDNAVKYTPPGGRVTLTPVQIGDSLRVAIRDNGMGIGPDDQKAIFDRFFRVRRPEMENIEGSGVGLALVKKLIDLHNGQIGLESRLGEGTTFYVTLPIWKES